MGQQIKKRWQPVPILVLILALVLAACSGDSADDSTETFQAISGELEEGAAEEPVEALSADEAGSNAEAPQTDDTLGSGGVEGGVLQTASLGRDIIFTADMTVAVTDVAAAGDADHPRAWRFPIRATDHWGPGAAQHSDFQGASW